MRIMMNYECVIMDYESEMDGRKTDLRQTVWRQARRTWGTS